MTDERLRQAILAALRNQPFQVSGLALRTQAISYAHLANILYAADWLRSRCILFPPAPGARPPFAPEYRKRTFRKAGSPIVTAMPVGLVQATEDVHRNRCDRLCQWRFEHPSDETLLYDATCIAAHAGKNLRRAKRLEKRNQAMKPFDAAFYQFLEGLAEEETVPLDIPADLTPA